MGDVPGMKSDIKMYKNILVINHCNTIIVKNKQTQKNTKTLTKMTMKTTNITKNCNSDTVHGGGMRKQADEE